MEAKKRVAEAIVASMHSQSEAQAARASFDSRFSRREVPSDMPSFTIPLASLSDGKIGIIDLMVITGMAESRGKARSLITQGAVRILDEKVTDFNAQIDLTNEVILKVGKLRYAKVGREA
jgi:tyrosyl-tRNA synthetase